MMLVVSLVGCSEARLFHAPPNMVEQLPATPDALLGEAAYRLGCNDVLEVAFVQHPEWDCTVSVSLDGRLPLHDGLSAPVEGRTVREAQEAIAVVTKCDVNSVVIKLVDCRAGRLYLVGPEAKLQRVVPFIGPEPVVEFLWRTGAMKPGSTEVRNVRVVRANIAIGTKPEVFPIDLEAILLDADQRTNHVLQASDQVIVGETRRSSFSRLLPDWLKPFYRKLAGLLPPDMWELQRRE
jgi:polysaccharide biosynthesis/export protein